MARYALATLAVVMLSWLAPVPAAADRPFVTDDARNIDAGQLEIETWPELVLRRGKVHLNLDITFGAQPVIEDGRQFGGKWEGWLQIGIRLLFDLFTDGPGDPMGASGMMPPPRF